MDMDYSTNTSHELAAPTSVAQGQQHRRAASTASAATACQRAHQHSSHHPSRPAARTLQARTLAPLLLLCLSSSLLLPTQVAAVKLKFRFEECVSYFVTQYEPLTGSFVSMPDTYTVSAPYDLTVTSPTGVKVHETHAQTEGKFNLVPYETGTYRFCLRISQDRSTSRYMMAREVIWDLHIGHHVESNTGSGGDSLKETDTQSLWHYVNQVDAQLQQLRATQQYLYWRERRHRSTVDSTAKRVKWYALARSSMLVLVSLAQVFAIRRMFSK